VTHTNSFAFLTTPVVAYVALLLPCPLWAGQQDNGKTVVVEGGTLDFIGFAKDGIVLSSDSAVSTNFKVTRSAQKIITIGRLGAVAIVGSTRISVPPNGRLLDFYRGVFECSATSTDILIARGCVANQISSELPQRLEFQNPNQELLLGLYFAGYVQGLRRIEVIEFVVPKGTTSPQKLQQAEEPALGFLRGWGVGETFAKAVLAGNIPELRLMDPVRMYIQRSRTGTLSEYTVKEMLVTQSFLLEQTEGPLGARFDPLNKVVVAPNLFLVIDPVRGSRWVDPPK
jgi:hypothetical protein